MENDTAQSGTVESPLESAARHTGGGAEAAPGHDAAQSERAARVAVEQRRLREWAEAHGKLKGKIPPEDSRGGEHTVHFHERTQRYLKATRPDAQLGYGIAHGSYSQGATPGEYLDRLVIHNQIFNDDIRLERVVVCGTKLSIVTSQPFIKGRDATGPEIDAYMTGKGFERIGEGAFWHPAAGLYVHDLLPKNAKCDDHGMVQPIDPVIQRVTREFAEFLREDFYRRRT